MRKTAAIIPYLLTFLFAFLFEFALGFFAIIFFVFDFNFVPTNIRDYIIFANKKTET